jgi:hypothetical protein
MTKGHITCDGCPVEQEDPHVLAGVATYRDKTTAYIALGMQCRMAVRANEADNIAHFRPNGVTTEDVLSAI